MLKRGFGDSTEVSDIRETTVVEDAHRALGYLRDTIGASSVIVWGHSQVLMMAMLIDGDANDECIGEYNDSSDIWICSRVLPLPPT